jgi:hypothetical protein
MVDEPEVEPVEPVPAHSPDALADASEEFGPVADPDKDRPETSREVEGTELRDCVAVLWHVRGEVHVRRSESENWSRGEENDRLYSGDSLKTSARDGGTVSLATGGSLVLNRSTSLDFKSQTEFELEKGEVLACSYKNPVILACSSVKVGLTDCDALVERRTRDTRVLAVNGKVQVTCGEQTSTIAAGEGIVVASDGSSETISKVSLDKELDWVCESGRKFKLWLEGECCRLGGYFVVQQNDPNLSNFASIHKTCDTSFVSWRVKLPHYTPCYIWIRYARSEREPEDIALVNNRETVDEKTITAAGGKWFWVKAFKTTLGRTNSMKLVFSSKKPVMSRIDLILITNDPNFKPPADMPKDGYYGRE